MLQLLNIYARQEEPPSLELLNAALHVLHRAGKWRLALELMGRMKKQGLAPNCKSFQEALGAFRSSRQWRKAVKLYNSMETEGVEPDAACIATVRAICLASGAPFLSRNEDPTRSAPAHSPSAEGYRNDVEAVGMYFSFGATIVSGSPEVTVFCDLR